MSANDLTRDELIACLDWQVACGADEAIGNQATHDQPFVPLKSFLSTPSAAGQANLVGARQDFGATCSTPGGCPLIPIANRRTTANITAANRACRG